MTFLNKTLHACAIATTIACALCACTTGIGFSADGANSDPKSQPPTEMITERLIAAENEAAARQDQHDISQLLGRHVSPYTIGRGDILSIVVWDHPELAGAGMSAAAVAADAADVNVGQATNVTQPGFVVDHQGYIQFPFAGLLSVEGLTEDQARAILTQKLARYIANPNVTLRIQSYRSKRVYIDGEVKQPGLQAINDIPMTLVEAINRAGGFLPTADQSRISLERGESHYVINLRDLVQKDINPINVMLVPGDVVRVHSRDESKVFVSGEVVAPKALTMHDGRLTLNEALGETGGINPVSGDVRQIYVLRKTQDRTRVFQLDARSGGALVIAEGFELHPKDIVYVAASPLANWSRSLSLIFPGALTSAVGTATRP